MFECTFEFVSLFAGTVARGRGTGAGSFCCLHCLAVGWWVLIIRSLMCLGCLATMIRNCRLRLGNSDFVESGIRCD